MTLERKEALTQRLEGGVVNETEESWGVGALVLTSTLSLMSQERRMESRGLLLQRRIGSRHTSILGLESM